MAMASDKKTVFVVDDDRDLGALITHVLEGSFRIEYFAAPTAALAALTQGASPDLLLLDVMMPGIDGFLALAKRARALPHLAQVPIIFLTTRGGFQDVVTGINAGARHYVVKPFKAADLLAKVQKTLA